MDRVTAYSKINRIKWLIEHKATGTPKQLAHNVGVSERTVYRLLHMLQELHHIEIAYSIPDNSYIISSSENSLLL